MTCMHCDYVETSYVGVHANSGKEAAKEKMNACNCFAGANAAMLAAMRLIGAKNATAEPKQLSSATDASPRPATPAAAVLPMLQSSPSGAKVRQVGMQAHVSGILVFYRLENPPLVVTWPYAICM